MIRKIGLIIGICTITAAAYAQDRAALMQEKASLQDRLSALEAEFAQNEEKTKTIDQKRGDLDWALEQLEGQAADLSAESDALDARTASLEAEISSHNSRCGGEYEDQSYVDACNARASDLNNQSSSLSNDIGQWNHTRELLIEAYTVQDEQRVLLDEQIEQYLTARADIINAAQAIQTRLAEIEPYVSSCEEAIRLYDKSPNPSVDGTMENMKAECGRLFDGN